MWVIICQIWIANKGFFGRIDKNIQPDLLDKDAFSEEKAIVKHIEETWRLLAKIVTRAIIDEMRKQPKNSIGLAGGIFLVLGIITGISVLLSYNTSNILAMGSALLTMLLVTIGMLSIFTGVILNVLVRRLGK